MDLSSFQREYFEVFRKLPADKREFILELMRKCVNGEILQERLAELIKEVEQGKKLEDIRATLQ
jgi:hypothetical protein